ncbi:hypothetical protein HPB52_001114 [Rhipicephalus sanguineus]|uniref:THAP-type domain-containing protein n=1 Tax=Rhipicephalus sanguineus TaxID=34632 RepID=A0A9D4QF74_RHISA|nr:hypothetical protein HPB52_001114 [Rhipicephalus sanguineus]
MPGTKCAVKGCRRGMPDVGVSFHVAPQNPFWRRQWDSAVGFTLPRNGRVCSDHFRVCDFLQLLYAKKPRLRRRLKSTAVPSMGLGTVWTTQQASLVESCKGRELRLLGDGRCDSPGHSAKYLTYTLMDAETKKVLNFTQVQVGQDPQVKKSPQMEKVGFVQCLREVRSKGLEVSSVTTDRHPGIRKHVREEEPGLKHDLDSWHVVKA